MDFQTLHFDGAPQLRTHLPGPRASEMLQRQAEGESNAYKYPRMVPLVPARGLGATIEDVDGNVFIDFFAGIGAVNCGHANPQILGAALAQAKDLVHALDFPSRVRVELIEALREIAPGALRGQAKVLFGAPSGSDAVEAAMKLVKHVTGRYGMVSFAGSYHGQTAGALSLCAGRAYKQDYMPLIPDVRFAPYPYCYRCPFKREPDSCDLLCLSFLEDLLVNSHSGWTLPAGLIIEPIKGEGGIIPAPVEYLTGLRELTKTHGIPLIVDEIQSGFGRTGDMFACEASGITPDVVTMAKSISGIGFPLAGVLYDPAMNTFKPGGHVGTFRGHLVGMAAARATLSFMSESQLLAHVARLESLVETELGELFERAPGIGDVRGRGLFWGVEFVKDRRTKEPDADRAAEVQRQCFERGLLVWNAGHHGNVVRIMPPLTITPALLQSALGILAESVLSA